MYSQELTPLQHLKISCLARGIRIGADAEERLTRGGETPLSIHEYATTGGLTLELDGAVFVNAPFDEWFCEQAEAVLSTDEPSGGYAVHFKNESFPVRALPLPGYLDIRDSQGRLATDTVMSHADRARLSPIAGCSFSCRFCDSSIHTRYAPRPVDQLLEALAIAQQDRRLPVKHVLISGGTPSPDDYSYLDDVCERVIRNTELNVDVMMWPRQGDIIDRLADWGVHGYALNIELYDDEIAQRLVPQKRQYGLARYAQSIERAVERTGGDGRVRSLIVVGLEPLESTLAGVEFIARLGCDPVLSAFRPARGTVLGGLPPPSADLLQRTYLESLQIVDQHGVKLGPRCIPCHHNTLTFPDDSGAYYHS